MSFFSWLFGKKKTTPAAPPRGDIILTPSPISNSVSGHLSPSERCIALIKRQEGLLLTAKKDVDGVYVNGYGCKIIDEKPAYEGQVITEAVANRSCRVHALKCSAGIYGFVKTKLSQGQLDALVDFVYNAGIGALQQSTILRTINAQQTVTENMFTMWSKAHVNGVLVQLPGLLDRRKAEYQLWIS
jgi:lysozyme